MSALTFAQQQTEVKKPLSSCSVLKCILLSSLNRFCLLFGLCIHITLVLVFRVRCQCALCATLPGLMTDKPAAKLPAPITSSNNSAHPCYHSLPSTSFKRRLLSTTTSQRAMASPLSSQSSTPEPVNSQQRMLPQTSGQRSTQLPKNALNKMQLLSSTQRITQSLIGMERNIQSLTRTESSMQPSRAPCNVPSPTSVQRTTESMAANMTVMFQPPYAVQDVVDAELKCAMLTIIDRMCGHDLFHFHCAARYHFCEEQPAVPVASPEPVTKKIWEPQLSGSRNTYPWILPDKVGELEEQLDSRMRNLWSAPPAFDQPAAETFSVDVGGKVRSGSLPALPTSLCYRTDDTESKVSQVVQQSTESISTVDIVNSGVSETDLPASIQLGAFAQPTYSSYSRLEAEEAIVSQDLAIQTELEPSDVAQPSFPSCGSTLSMARESTFTPSVVVTDITQFLESTVAPENEPLVIASEDAQSEVTSKDTHSLLVPVDLQGELRALSKQNKLTALQERQEMQQRQLQAMREKRVLKKKKRRKEKKRKQQQCLH